MVDLYIKRLAAQKNIIDKLVGNPCWLVLGIALVLAMQPSSALGQDFINGNLEGSSEALDSLPPFWERVSFNDPVSLATAETGEIPDILSQYGPLGQFGIFGEAFAGQTFVGGNHGQDLFNGGFVHEGIQQTVSGFVPGTSYSVNFHQTVVRLSSALDTSGSWAVYMDSTLIGYSEASGTAKTFKSVTLDWEFRSLYFWATDSVHTFKFLPMDDDIFHAQPFFNLYMGIDSIFIQENAVLGNATIDLDLQHHAEGVQLSWSNREGGETTTTTVLRSHNGLRFDTLAIFEKEVPNGFLDDSPLTGENHYQIIEVDRAGQVVKSNIEHLHFSPPTVFWFDGTSLRSKSDNVKKGQWRLRLIDTNGRTVLAKEMVESLELRGLGRGLYIAQFSESTTGRAAHVKFVIQ